MSDLRLTSSARARSSRGTGGEVLDVVRAIEVVEGEWPIGALTALVQFPDEASLRAFWDSPENAAMKDLRHGSATSNVALCLSLPQVKQQ
jgi:uncharacterized protein (DUF1330 family)